MKFSSNKDYNIFNLVVCQIKSQWVPKTLHLSNFLLISYNNSNDEKIIKIYLSLS